ncbi:MAG: ABC transporter ATP-binding protein [Candidatus Hydrogenedentes bacterium]|jgi:iron complex transport system ATP-binding protein|nr:ABC transporter ATP-binding protein [Candidatus Hydrogenedentota bacterium]
MTSPAYEIKDLSIVLDGQTIVKELSFSLEAGQSMAIIGPNGAGKSTLLKAMLRLIPIASGSIQLFGKALQRYDHKYLARAAAYVPQSAAVNLPFTVGEFVLMGRYAYLSAFSNFTALDYEAAEKAMVQADVLSLSERSLFSLSGGERQKVYLAAAIAQEPRVLLLDEATAFLDYKHQVDILNLTESLQRETRLSVVAVTHDLNQRILHYNRVLALKQGQIVYWGAPEGLLDTALLEDIYETPFRFLEDPQWGGIHIVPQGSVHEEP